MAETAPVRKRAVSAKRVGAAPSKARKGFRAAPAPVLEEEEPKTNFALRITEALDAIAAAQSEQEPAPVAQAVTQPQKSVFDRLSPVKMPVGPAIPWKLALPLLVALFGVMAFMNRPTPTMPAPQTYPVQQEAPLFADSSQPDPQPIGVKDSQAPSFDVVDVGIKLVAVLALAYGSILVLKRMGLAGAAATKTVGDGMRVVESVALAPNRSVHVLRVPGGRTLLVGATPNSVNLLVDLGEQAREAPEASSFFEVLKSKI